MASWLLLKVIFYLTWIAWGKDTLNATYENIILIGDFNVQPYKINMSDFSNIDNFKNLIKQNTCYKNREKPSCIEKMLTNFQRSFQNTCLFETGFSGFHKMTVTVMKLHFPKQKPKLFFTDIITKYELKFGAELENETYMQQRVQIFFKCLFWDL